MLTKLEKAGLVGRRVGATDRRKRSLALTPAGDRMLKRLEEPARRTMARQLSAFEPHERKLFLQMLEKFIRTFNESTRVPLEAQRGKKSLRSFRGAAQQRTRNDVGSHQPI